MFDLTDLTPYERPGATVEAGTRRLSGFHVKFDNGWTLSVQFGAGNYCANHDHRDFMAPAVPSPDAEIAAWNGKSGMLEWTSGDTVAGWQPAAHVHHLLDLMAADSLDSSKPMPAVSPRPEATA